MFYFSYIIPNLALLWGIETGLLAGHFLSFIHIMNKTLGIFIVLSLSFYIYICVCVCVATKKIH